MHLTNLTQILSVFMCLVQTHACKCDSKCNRNRMMTSRGYVRAADHSDFLLCKFALDTN